MRLLSTGKECVLGKNLVRLRLRLRLRCVRLVSPLSTLMSVIGLELRLRSRGSINESGMAASRIIFSRRPEDGDQDLYVIDSDGENFRRLTDQIAIVSHGQAVIYRDGETGQNYVVRFTREEQVAFEGIEVLERRLGYVRERVAELRRDGDISN